MTPTARHPALARYLLEHAIERGSFRLASGRTSSYYCDVKKASFAPEGIALIVEAILEEIRGLDLHAVGGMDMGATPIVAALALRSHQVGRPVPTFVVRKERKGHGMMKRVEGLLPAPPARLVIVDDVVTSAGSIIDAIDAVRESGHEVILAMCVLDREAGGAAAIRGKGVTYRPLVSIRELGISE